MYDSLPVECDPRDECEPFAQACDVIRDARAFRDAEDRRRNDARR